MVDSFWTDKRKKWWHDKPGRKQSVMYFWWYYSYWSIELDQWPKLRHMIVSEQRIEEDFFALVGAKELVYPPRKPVDEILDLNSLLP